jgi:predicted N-acetyltransferase YhbS
MMRLRPLEDTHAPHVLRIQRECYREIVPESLPSLRAKWRASPDTCFVAEAAAGVVGYLICVPVLIPDLSALDAPAFGASA